jgi:hypothetical protein
MKILDSRYLVLEYILNAYDKINVPFIGFDGASFLPMSGTAGSWTGCFDDIGIYIFIPKIIKLLNISLQQGIDIFFYGLLYIPFLIASYAFFLLYNSWKARSACLGFLAFLLHSIASVPITDVYLAYGVAPLSIIPLCMYFLQKKLFWPLSCFVLLSGILLGCLHYIRSYSGLSVIAFMVVAFLANTRITIQQKIALACLLCFGLSIPYGYFSYQVHSYNVYCAEHFKECDVTSRHVFWTTLYAGFGFLKYLNADNISFEDDFVINKIQKNNPELSYLTMHEFEKAAKQEVLDLWKHQSFFVLVTLFAKLGVLFFYLLKYANIGLLSLFFMTSICWWQELAWLCCLGISALFPIMTLPQGNYSLSFIVTSALFGLVHIANMLELCSIDNLFKRLNKYRYMLFKIDF